MSLGQEQQRERFAALRDRLVQEQQRERFAALRDRYLAADQALTTARASIESKYGSKGVAWASRGEKKQVETLSARRDREGNKLLALITEISPRDWHSGVPAHWVLSTLSYEDAVRPLGEPLSVVPPCSYGQTEPMR